MKEQKYSIGIDFGTDSVRAVVVDVNDGSEIGSAVHMYKRWKEGLFCDPTVSRYRQHPLDYIEGLKGSVIGALENLSKEQKLNVVGISVDTTGSTPVAVNKQGIPLALTAGFEVNPNAMFVLWKDHTAIKESEEINKLSVKWEENYTKYVGGIYSSEWFWAKILHILRTDDGIAKNAFSWVEHCDWISALLTGDTNPLTIKRSRCAAGHKAMWNETFGGLPENEFFKTLDPILDGLTDRLYKDTYTSDINAGTISSEWASDLGLSEDVVIGVGAFDCHMGAVGAQIKSFDFVRVMGTSTCDMIVVPLQEYGHILVKGICGQVDGSIVPNMLGLEAGQSAYGDYYAWFKNVIMGPVNAIMGEETAKSLDEKLIPYLSDEASKIEISINDPVATDWINGRRTPDANQKLKATLSGLTLGSDAVKIFKSIVEATAFGSKAIIDRFVEEGIPIKQLIAIGGVAKKSKFAMQVLADVLDMPIKVARADQACALGAAMFASVAAGAHENVEAAQEAMGSGYEETYYPQEKNIKTYNTLYNKYKSLGEHSENYG